MDPKIVARSALFIIMSPRSDVNGMWRRRMVGVGDDDAVLRSVQERYARRGFVHGDTADAPLGWSQAVPVCWPFAGAGAEQESDMSTRTTFLIVVAFIGAVTLAYSQQAASPLLIELNAIAQEQLRAR